MSTIVNIIPGNKKSFHIRETVFCQRCRNTIHAGQSVKVTGNMLYVHSTLKACARATKKAKRKGSA